MNHLISVFNETSKQYSLNNKTFKSKNIQKTEKDNKNDQKDILIFTKNIKDYKTHKQAKKNHILKFQESPDITIQNKNQLHQHTILKKRNIIQPLYDLYKVKRLNQVNEKSIKNSKNILSFKHAFNYKNNLLPFKSINKSNTFIKEKFFFKEKNQKNNFNTNSNLLFFENAKYFIEWKKSINRAILMSISKNQNEIKMHLKPEFLGHIYIKIQMKNNQAMLNFISNNFKIRSILDNYVPTLRDSLIQNGIFLKAVNIHDTSFLNIKEIKNNKNLFKNNFFSEHISKQEAKQKIKEEDKINYQVIDTYI